jgi:hypothetical protein
MSDYGLIFLRARTGFDLQSKLKLASRGGYVRPQTAWQIETTIIKLFRSISVRRNWLSRPKNRDVCRAILARAGHTTTASVAGTGESERNSLSPADDSVVEDAGSRVPIKLVNVFSEGWKDRGSTPLASII